MLSIVHHPCDAGASVSGRTKTRQRSLPGDAPRVQGSTRQGKRDDGPTLRHAHPPASRSGAPLRRHLAQRDDQRTCEADQPRGAGREGGALWQGMVGGGVCGRRMTVRDRPDGLRPLDVCTPRHTECAGTPCQGMRGDGMDAAVGPRLCAAIEPAPLPIALEAVEPLAAPACAMEHPWHLRRERARYEADRARRRSQDVAPAYRVVARRLERDGHAQRSVLDQLERDAAVRAPAAASPVREAERQGLLDVVHALPAGWQAETTTHAARTQVVRVRMQDVMLTTRATTLRIDVRWPTPACRTLEVPRPQPASVRRRTAPEVVERVRQWARHHTAIAMAARRKHAGSLRGPGGACAARKVEWLREADGITSGCP